MSALARIWKVCILLCGFIFLAVSAGSSYGQGQAIMASLNGTVTDPSGQAISGAKLTLTNADRGFTRSYATDETGLYSFTLLPPGTYKLVVEAPSFKRYAQDGISLAAGQVADQKISLTIGAVSEIVEVSS